MDPVSWGVEGAEVCEGFDHEDAEALDVQYASEQLIEAAEYFVTQNCDTSKLAPEGPRQICS